MAAGDVTVFIDSVNKIEGTELIASDIYASTVLLGSSRDIQTSVVPRTSNLTGAVTYDVITVVTELT